MSEPGKTFKIAFIGGGSVGWTPTVIRDIIFKEGMETIALEFALLDSHLPRAEAIHRLFNVKLQDWKVDRVTTLPTSETHRALKGADFVIITISTGGLSAMANDLSVPERYGIYHTVGDTAGPGGWARALRNIPVFKAFAEQIKELAPDAFVLNYTNPLAVLTKVLSEVLRNDRVIGLCHGLFENRDALVKMFDLKDPNDLRLRFAGLNHFFWILDFAIHGRDGYGLLRAKLKDGRLADLIREATGDERPVANELFESHGVLPYFGDRHTSEFFSCYMSNKGLMERFKLSRTPISTRERSHKLGAENVQRWTTGTEAERAQFGSKPSSETAADIIKAIIFNQGFTDVMNLVNVGQVDNLPRGAVVESLGYVDAGGARPLTAGPLPDSVRAILTPHADAQLGQVSAGLSGNLNDALTALVADPVCAHLTASDTTQLGRELLESNRQYLPQFFGD